LKISVLFYYYNQLGGYGEHDKQGGHDEQGENGDLGGNNEHRGPGLIDHMIRK
jgi:hypothetical protein